MWKDLFICHSALKKIAEKERKKETELEMSDKSYL